MEPLSLCSPSSPSPLSRPPWRPAAATVPRPAATAAMEASVPNPAGPGQYLPGSALSPNAACCCCRLRARARSGPRCCSIRPLAPVPGLDPAPCTGRSLTSMRGGGARHWCVEEQRRRHQFFS
ncbi:hypothetical protein BRADI_1g42795v3 [Brachypodium distachyon]|uniref:Uncharacterized protein n=1 Tax=Brachypodium distachyon TaxID=15368 RepID=A0A2K2DP00_BRADI|nr:hypothetical protein BRADI_1g42795v3 [Brachypodium distachyon]